MHSEITTLKDLETFVENRPDLKVKVDEALAVLGIIDYVQCNPAIKNINVRGGNKHYDDNGKDINNGYVRTNTTLQVITFDVSLINDKSIYVTTKQRKNSNYDVVVRNYYADGGYGGRKGKAVVVELMKAIKTEIESGVNPYQEDLDRAIRNKEIRQKEMDALQAEMKILEPLKESVPTAYYELKSKITSKQYEVERTVDKVEVTQHKFDKCVIKAEKPTLQ